jgi:hypothetical protein
VFSPDEPLQGAPSLQTAAQLPAQPPSGATADPVHSAGQAQPVADSSAAETRSTSALFALTTAYSKARAKAKPSLGRPRQAARPVHSDGGSPAAAAAAPKLQPSNAAHSAPPPAAAAHAAPDSSAAGAAAVAAAAPPSDQPALRRKRSNNAELKLSRMLRDAEAAQAAAGSSRRRSPPALQPGARPSPEPPRKATPPPDAALPAAPAERLGVAAGGGAGGKPKYVRMPGSSEKQQRQQAPCEETVPRVTVAATPEPAAAAGQVPAEARTPSDQASAAAAHLGNPWTPQLVASLLWSKQYFKQELQASALHSASVKPTDKAFRKARAQRILQHMGCPPGLSLDQVSCCLVFALYMCADPEHLLAGRDPNTLTLLLASG